MTKENKIYLFLSGWVVLSLVCFFGDRSSAVGSGEYSNFGYLCLSFFWSFIILCVIVLVFLLVASGKHEAKDKNMIEQFEKREKEQQERCLNKFLQISFDEIDDNWGSKLCGSACIFALIKENVPIPMLEKTIFRLYTEVFTDYLYDYVLGCFNNKKYIPRYPESKVIRERNLFFDYWGKNARYDKKFMDEIEATFYMKKNAAIIVAHYCEYKIKKMSGIPEDFRLSKLFERDYSIGYGDSVIGPYCRKYLMPSQFNTFNELASKGVKCLQIAYFYYKELTFLISLEKENKK